MKNLKKLQDKVEYCLSNFPDSRNNDILLSLILWTKFYGVKEYIHVDNFYKLPSQDSIKRIRAKFQSPDNKNPQYLPTKISVAIKRGWQEEKWRSYLGYNPELRTVSVLNVQQLPI